jgi:tetratricopeptide (TPR) repeat protein
MIDKKRLFFFGLGIFLIVTIYFGCDIVDPRLQDAESQRALTFQPTDFINIKRTVVQEMSAERRNMIESLEFALERADSDERQAELHKELSRNWMQFGVASLAGYHAEQVAQIEMTADAWSIAGSTYSICYQRSDSEREAILCGNRSVASFENAVSLEPNNLDFRLNLAVTLADHPPANNPMLGITQLIELNRQNPDYVPALYNLGRLAIQTGQYQRAVERLERAFELEPDNQRVICLLPVAYIETGDEISAAKFAELCQR